MRTVAHQKPHVKQITVIPSWDSAELFVCSPPTGMRRTIERAQQGEIQTRDVTIKTRDGKLYVGTLFIVNQPKLEVLPVLDWMVEHVRNCFRHRIDIAVDWQTMTGADERLVFEMLDQNGTVKWMSRRATKKWVSWGDKKRQVKQGDGRFPWSVYWGQEMSSRVAVLYQKRTGVIRSELRFQGAGSVKRLMKWLGANTFEDMVDLNPRELFDHHFRLVSCKEGYIKQAVRWTVKQDRLKHLSRQSRSENAFVDRYRANIEQHVRGIYANMDMHGFKRWVRNPSRLIEGLEVDWWEIPSRLVWPISAGGVIENIGVFKNSVGQCAVITPTPSSPRSRALKISA